MRTHVCVVYYLQRSEIFSPRLYCNTLPAVELSSSKLKSAGRPAVAHFTTTFIKCRKTGLVQHDIIAIGKGKEKTVPNTLCVIFLKIQANWSQYDCGTPVTLMLHVDRGAHPIVYIPIRLTHIWPKTTTSNNYRQTIDDRFLRIFISTRFQN